VTALSRDGGDMVLYTDGGVTLFERTPRAVSFNPSPVYVPGTTGNAVYVDGVAVTGPTATMPLNSGRIVGATELRDEVSLTYQTQLDEAARALIEVFAEVDQSGGGNPDMAGLFTDGGGAMPTSSLGLAKLIRVNAAADTAQGGHPNTVRDGGMNGTDYVYNAADVASFADRLVALGKGLSTPRTFDPDSKVPPNSSLLDFTTNSIGWLEGQRSAASATADSEETLLKQTSDALSNATGINIDEEYAKQLEYERSYQASSKLIALIGDLYDTLLQSVN
jgi:flagellar hook-associated protein 1